MQRHRLAEDCQPFSQAHDLLLVEPEQGALHQFAHIAHAAGAQQRVAIEHGEQVAERTLDLEVLPLFTFGEFHQMGQEQFGGQSAASRHFVKRLPGTLQHHCQGVARDLAQTDIPAPAVQGAFARSADYSGSVPFLAST